MSNQGTSLGRSWLAVARPLQQSDLTRKLTEKLSVKRQRGVTLSPTLSHDFTLPPGADRAIAAERRHNHNRADVPREERKWYG